MQVECVHLVQKLIAEKSEVTIITVILKFQSALTGNS